MYLFGVVYKGDKHLSYVSSNSWTHTHAQITCWRKWFFHAECVSLFFYIIKNRSCVWMSKILLPIQLLSS